MLGEAVAYLLVSSRQSQRTIRMDPQRQNSPKLILASASPRRRELLHRAGIEVEVVPAHVNEDPRPGEDPKLLAERLAREKAGAVFARYPQSFVLGADTIVIVDGHVLNKPADADDAARMLRMLSGRRHQVTTGVCLLGPEVRDVRSETTEVEFQRLSEEEIRGYVVSGEPMDKAGAYGIQGRASRWIPRVEGCYFNVVGLPVPLVYRMLRENGVI